MATRLQQVELFDGERAGAVVSGIPLLLVQAKSVNGGWRARSYDSVDGAFYRFTYGLDAPIAGPILERLGLKATRIGGTFASFPPAAVYRIRRRSSRVIPMRWTGDCAILTPTNAPLRATRTDCQQVLRMPLLDN